MLALVLAFILTSLVKTRLKVLTEVVFVEVKQRGYVNIWQETVFMQERQRPCVKFSGGVFIQV